MLLGLALVIRPLHPVVKSGQLVHDTVQVLSDEFLDMENVATGKIAKTEREITDVRVMTWRPLLGKLG